MIFSFSFAIYNVLTNNSTVEEVVEVIREFVPELKVEFVDNQMLSRDSLAFREYLIEITPDIDMSFIFVSESTGEDHEMDMPLDLNFFWPAGRR